MRDLDLVEVKDFVVDNGVTIAVATVILSIPFLAKYAINNGYSVNFSASYKGATASASFKK